MFLSLILQRLIFFTFIASILFLFFCYKPKFVLSFKGAVLCSLLIGLHASFITYQASNTLIKSLQYFPTGKSREYFDNHIKAVGLNPDDVSFRYGYCNSNIALTSFNTIIIDQMLWKGIDKDPMCIAAQNIVKKDVEPILSVPMKQLHEKINHAFTRDVQNFIFKHELGHVVDKYTWKAVMLTGVIGFVSFYSGFYVVQLLVAYEALVALGTGIGVASFVSVSLDLLKNAFFKAPKEKEADLFAVKHSSKKEIEAAADFFEKYEKYSQEYRNAIGDTHSVFAPRFLMGYCSGEERVKYLRDSLLKK